ncbi:hypothetical protein EDC96DRAFT_545759 [Choanephora cucurbitarum]|nr:hypothetical protein EDC96DRAFT_545759 [Choanephora cucurbitarum]
MYCTKWRSNRQTNELLQVQGRVTRSILCSPTPQEGRLSADNQPRQARTKRSKGHSRAQSEPHFVSPTIAHSSNWHHSRGQNPLIALLFAKSTFLVTVSSEATTRSILCSPTPQEGRLSADNQPRQARTKRSKGHSRAQSEPHFVSPTIAHSSNWHHSRGQNPLIALLFAKSTFLVTVSSEATTRSILCSPTPQEGRLSADNQPRQARTKRSKGHSRAQSEPHFVSPTIAHSSNWHHSRGQNPLIALLFAKVHLKRPQSREPCYCVHRKYTE